MGKTYFQFSSFQKQLPLLSFLTIIGIFLDQLSKYWAVETFSNPVTLTPWFHLVFEKNYGIAFSIAIPYYFLLTLNIFLLFGLAIFLANQLNGQKIFSVILLSLLLSGALGNLIDRIRLGYVIDFISIGTFPVFNLADSYISVSVFLLLVFYDKIRRLN